METTSQLQLSEFQKALTPQRMRIFLIISLALLAGCTLFLGIILLLYSKTESANTVLENSVLPLVSLVHGCMALAGYIPAYLVGRYFASPKGLVTHLKNTAGTVAGEELTIESRCVGAIFTGFIIRAAILEGMALFGLIICLLGVLEGEIHLAPVYWANLFSYILFTAVMLWTFPTKGRLEKIFKDRFLPSELRI